MKLNAALRAATAFLGLIPAFCQAQEFSADVVYFAAAKPSNRSSKIFVSKDRMRLETRGLSDTILLVNRGENTAAVLFPARKSYQPLTTGPSEYFRVEDPEDACPPWQRATDQKIVCEKVGHAVVDGRQTVKYQNKAASEAATAAVWIDLALKFVVKWEGVGTGAELRNIQEAQQAEDLFTVPSGYQVLKPPKQTSKGFAQRSR